jgi:sugar lactone lactonase YvrE
VQHVRRLPRFSSLGIALLIAAGCNTGAPVGTPKNSPTPNVKRVVRPSEPAQALGALRPIPQTGQKISLIGRISLIAQPGAPILGDQGGSILSNNGGTLLSDQGGSIISNNGGNLIGNNGAGLLGKAKWVFGLQQEPTAPLGVYGLSDATITLHDASGQTLVDENNQPLTATSGPDANYTLSAVLPPGNLVAKIKLWNGGELQALVTPEGRNNFTLEINTSTTLGAAYVLNKFVSGQQAILNKLPASENARLTQELDVIRAYAQAAFKHDDTLLNTVTDGLRTREPRVDRVIEDVKALLLGQTALGRGLQATEVPLAGPVHLTWLRSGRLALGESLIGRVRTLNPDGTLDVLMDKTHGRIKYNMITMGGFVEGPGGTFYGVVPKAHQVFRVSEEGTGQVWLGSGKRGRTPPGNPLTMDSTPRSLAMGPDGTLWVGEETYAGDLPPRLLALRPDRTVEVFAPPPGALGSIIALAVDANGAVFMLRANDQAGSLWRFQNGTFSQVAGTTALSEPSGLHSAPDGTLYVTEPRKRRLLKLGASGLEEAHRFATGGPRLPGSITAGPDGSLFVADLASNVVWQGTPGGNWRAIAGTEAVFQQGDTQAFAINTSMGVAADDKGNLYIAEAGSHSIKRFDGKGLSVLVGENPTEADNLGDGGPAAQARLLQPTSVAWHQGQLYLLDYGHGRLRRVGSDNLIQTVSTTGETPYGLTFDASGQPCWILGCAGVIVRRNSDNSQDTLAGVREDQIEKKLPDLLAPPTNDPAKLALGIPIATALSPAGELHFSDMLGGRVFKLQTQPDGSRKVVVVAGNGTLISLAQFQANPNDDRNGKQATEVGLSIPVGLAFDAQGNLYVAEVGDRNLDAIAPYINGKLPLDPAMLPGYPPRVLKISPLGVVSTIAGPGGKFFTQADGEDALYAPWAITVTPDGRLVFTDIGANLVRILPAGSY